LDPLIVGEGVCADPPAGRVSAGAPAGLWVAVTSGFPSPGLNGVEEANENRLDLGQAARSQPPSSFRYDGRTGHGEGRVMDNGQDRVDIGTAAIRMGITTEAIRKRIGRGTIPATKQDGRWQLVLDGVQDAVQDASSTSGVGRPAQDIQDGRPDDKDKLIETLTAELEARRQELQELQADRRREVQELHVLLQTAQTALAAPQHRPWWRWWK